jgi:hypothetical protein
MSVAGLADTGMSHERAWTLIGVVARLPMRNHSSLHGRPHTLHLQHRCPRRRRQSSSPSETAGQLPRSSSKLFQSIIAGNCQRPTPLQPTAHGAPAASHVKFGVPLRSANDARRCCRSLALPCRPSERQKAVPRGWPRRARHNQSLPGCSHHLPFMFARLAQGLANVAAPSGPARWTSPHGCSNVGTGQAS